MEIVVSCPSTILAFTSAYRLEVEATIGLKNPIVRTPIKNDKMAGVLSIDNDDFPAALKTINSELRARDKKIHAELIIIIRGNT